MKPRNQKIEQLFESIENTLLSRFTEAGFVAHAGDKGENREHILREFFEKHLPKRYGITKGEIVTKDGKHSHSADIIIYDAINCPVLYSEKTAIIPAEGVYGIVEVKSTLSKTELVDAIEKIAAFKRLAPRDLSIIETREYVTVHRPSRPFGIILGYSLSGNSLDSLSENWQERNKAIHDVNYFANFVCVLGKGLLRHEKVNLTRGEKTLLIDTDEFVNLVLTTQKKKRNEESMDEIILRVIKEELENRTFGRFLVYLLIILSRMKVGVPDLGQYIDQNLPRAIIKES